MTASRATLIALIVAALMMALPVTASSSGLRHASAAYVSKQRCGEGGSNPVSHSRRLVAVQFRCKFLLQAFDLTTNHPVALRAADPSLTCSRITNKHIQCQIKQGQGSPLAYRYRQAIALLLHVKRDWCKTSKPLHIEIFATGLIVNVPESTRTSGSFSRDENC